MFGVTISGLNAQIEELKNEVSQLQIENIKLKKDLDWWRKGGRSIEEARSENKKLQDQIEDLNKEIVGLRKCIVSQDQVPRDAGKHPVNGVHVFSASSPLTIAEIEGWTEAVQTLFGVGNCLLLNNSIKYEYTIKDSQ